MDILNSDVLISESGYIVGEIRRFNNSVIYKIFTENYGLIDVYTNNVNVSLSIGSKYFINIICSKDMFILRDFELILYNSFINKNKILFLNLINEIILKTSIQENPNKDIFLLIEEIIGNYELYDYKVILIYFIYKYMLFNGYHIIENISKNYDSNVYFFDILNLEILDYDNNHRYVYKIDIMEKNFLADLAILNSLKFLKCNFDDYNIHRILGILINSLCVNFAIKNLNTYKMIT